MSVKCCQRASSRQVQILRWFDVQDVVTWSIKFYIMVFFIFSFLYVHA